MFDNVPQRNRRAPDFVFDNLDSLRKLRIAMHWSKKHIALHIGSNTKHYHNIERGYVFPSKLIYNKLAKLFDWEKWI